MNPTSIKKMTTDVIICGGGPGGISCAFTLGKSNVNTIIIDKKPKNKIGDKVCGDALSPKVTKQAFDLIGLPQPDPDKKELMEYADVMLLQGGLSDVKVKLSGKSATVDRLRYGQALLKSVEQFPSVKVISDARIISTIVEGNKLIGITVKTREKNLEIYSKIVVDATGTNGVVRARLPDSMCTKFPKKIKQEDIIVAYREIVKTKKPHQFQRGLFLKYEPEMKDVMPGYYWFFSRGENELNIGLGYPKFENTHGKNIRKINEQIRDRYLDNFEVLASQGDQIPARLPLESLVHNGFIAVGDAGCLANPLNGEGHGPALMSGINAGKIIIKALEKNDYSESGLWEFNKWVWKTYGVEFCAGTVFIKFVRKYGYDTFEWFIQQKIVTAGDLHEPSRIEQGPGPNLFVRLFKALKRPLPTIGLIRVVRLMKQLQSLAINYPTIENFDTWNSKLHYLLDKEV